MEKALEFMFLSFQCKSFMKGISFMTEAAAGRESELRATLKKWIISGQHAEDGVGCWQFCEWVGLPGLPVSTSFLPPSPSSLCTGFLEASELCSACLFDFLVHGHTEAVFLVFY